MEILSNLLLASRESVNTRTFLLGEGYSLEDAEKTAIATGFDNLSRFGAMSVDRLISENGETLRSHLGGLATEIRLIIVASQTNNRKIPNGASLLQSELNLQENVLCYEIVDGCNGFVKALHLADRLLEDGEVGVIFAGELNSVMVKDSAPGTSVLFGDGFGLTVIRKTGPFSSMMMQSGKRGGAIRFGGEDTSLVMKGLEVFAFTSAEVPRLMAPLSEHGYSELRFPVFHQASRLIVEQLGRKVGATSLPFPLFNSGNVGNLGAGSIPSWIANQGDILKGSELICVGFGAGLSWGYATAIWTEGANEIIYV